MVFRKYLRPQRLSDNNRAPLAVIVLVLAVCLVFSIIAPVNAQDAPAEAGVFDPLEVAPGEVVQVPISIRAVKDLYGIDIALKFDPALVQVEDMDSSMSGIQAALGEFLDPGLLLFNTADNDAGTYHFVMAQYNPSEPKSGEGVVLVITFRGIAEGVSDIKVTALTLASREGNEIPSSKVDSILTVRSGAPAQVATFPVVQSTALVIINTFTPTPTETPIPTATATPVVEPTQVTSGGDNPAEIPPAGSVKESAEPGFWLVENWWLVLVLLVIVISAGLYLFVWKKKRNKEGV